eukprot:COSAG05_NODE_158_length_15673_cov_23.898946_4_plen_58_part_00
MKKFCSTNATDAQDRIVNARVYAAQIIADNEVFVSEPWNRVWPPHEHTCVVVEIGRL